MDKLQIENGNFTQIVNPLIEQLIKLPFKGCELAVAMFIIRKTYGYKKLEDEISLTQFEEGLKRGRPTIVKALHNLQLVNVVKLVSRGTSKKQSNCWAINKYYNTWELVNTVKLVKTKMRTSKGVYTKTSKGVLTHKRNINKHTKEIATNVAEWSFKEAIKKLEDSPRRDLNIIAFYFEERKPVFHNRDQMASALRRHLRAAKELIPFTDDQILTGSKKAAKQTNEWTLETVLKMLSK